MRRKAADVETAVGPPKAFPGPPLRFWGSPQSPLTLSLGKHI